MNELKEKFKRIVQNNDPEILASLLSSMADHIDHQKKLINQLQVEKTEHEQRSFNRSLSQFVVKTSLSS